MATQRIKTSKAINRFLKEINKQFSIKRAILFGSQSRGHAKIQ